MLGDNRNTCFKDLSFTEEMRVVLPWVAGILLCLVMAEQRKSFFQNVKKTAKKPIRETDSTSFVSGGGRKATSDSIAKIERCQWLASLKKPSSSSQEANAVPARLSQKKECVHFSMSSLESFFSRAALSSGDGKVIPGIRKRPNYDNRLRALNRTRCWPRQSQLDPEPLPGWLLLEQFL